MGKSNHDKSSSSGSGGKGAKGYEVGVYKNGKLKRVLDLRGGLGYVKSRISKERANKPKRSCSDKQLAALAKGRAIRSAMRSDGSGSGAAKRHGPKKPRKKDHHLHTESKSMDKRKAEKARLRRAKESSSGKHRKEDEYTSSDPESHGVTDSDSSGSD